MSKKEKSSYQLLTSAEHADTPRNQLTSGALTAGLKENTTAHGIPHIARARGVFKHVFWGIIVLACTTMLVYHLTVLSILFFSWKVSVTINIYNERELFFPAITVCNVNPIKRTALQHNARLQYAATAAITTSRKRRKKRETEDKYWISGNASNMVEQDHIQSLDLYYDGANLDDLDEYGDGRGERLKRAAPTTSTLPPSPLAVLAPPQYMTNSKYPDRIIPRESFIRQSRIMEVLADMSVTEKASYGHQFTEFVMDCQYAGHDCFLGDFDHFFNNMHGNCFAFNSGWNRSVALKTSTRTGRRYGLHLTLNIDQDMYVESMGEEAGARVLVHHQESMPFPEDEGVLVLPGQVASIGLRKTSVIRRGWPYGNCTDTNKYNGNINVYEDHHPVKYTNKGCYKSCYQRHLIETCGCTDPLVPKNGTAFGQDNLPTCNTSDITTDDCKYGVSKLFNDNELDCPCTQSCSDTFFIPGISYATWPSDVNTNHILKTLSKKSVRVQDYMNNVNDTEIYRKNLLKLEIYFEEFNYEMIRELPAYDGGQFASDIGGILGLWVGMSVMTIFEFVEFFMDLLALCFIKYANEPMPKKAKQVKVKPKDVKNKNVKGGVSGSKMATAGVLGFAAGKTLKLGNTKGNSENNASKKSKQNSYDYPSNIQTTSMSTGFNRRLNNRAAATAAATGAAAVTMAATSSSQPGSNLSNNYNTQYSRFNQKKVDSVSQYGSSYSRMSNSDSSDSVSTARSISSVKPRIAGATVATGHGVTPGGGSKDSSPPPPYSDDWPEEDYQFVHPLMKV